MICYMSLTHGNRFCLSIQNKKNIDWYFHRIIPCTPTKAYDPMCDETIFLALGKCILETHERNEAVQIRNVITGKK